MPAKMGSCGPPARSASHAGGRRRRRRGGARARARRASRRRWRRSRRSPRLRPGSARGRAESAIAAPFALRRRRARDRRSRRAGAGRRPPARRRVVAASADRGAESEDQHERRARRRARRACARRYAPSPGRLRGRPCRATRLAISCPVRRGPCHILRNASPRAAFASVVAARGASLAAAAHRQLAAAGTRAAERRRGAAAGAARARSSRGPRRTAARPPSPAGRSRGSTSRTIAPARRARPPRPTAGTARLTLDPELAADRARADGAHHLPEAAVVLMDVATGALLVYASHVEKGAAARPLRRGHARRPRASSRSSRPRRSSRTRTSGPTRRQCYSGGEQRITATDLVDDPQRDRWCTTLARRDGAQHQHGLRAARERAPRAAAARGDGAPLRLRAGRAVRRPGAAERAARPRPSRSSSRARRRASGTRRSRRSQAAEMSAIVARGGEAVRPSIVEQGRRRRRARSLWSAPDGPATRGLAPRDRRRS